LIDDVSIEIKVYEEADCLELVDKCQAAFAKESDDKWRLREWPFASRPAAVQEYAALILDGDGFFPIHAFAVQLHTHTERTTVGVITLSFHGFDDSSGWIGTYIAPQYRGLGLQKIAKEQVFARLPNSIKGLYGMIAPDNTASILAAKKLPYCEFIAPDTIATQPSPVQNAYWKENGRILIVFYLLASLRV
jgi:RimJ/RimL family protein N-acetyltransferase